MVGHRCSLAWRTLACASLLGPLAAQVLAEEPPRRDDPLPVVEAPVLWRAVETTLPAEPARSGESAEAREPEASAESAEPAEAPDLAESDEAALDPEVDAPVDFPSFEEVAPPPIAPPESAFQAPPVGAPAAEVWVASAAISRESLRRFVVAEPTALGPLSIGTPDGGLLFNPVPMPEGSLWAVRNPRDSFGTVETIGFIATAVETVEKRFPGSPRLVIGDISRADGGRLDRHKSHQAGRDADIGFYYRAGEAASLVPARKGELDLPRTWALLRAFVTETDVERVFLDRQVQRLLYEYARDAGEDHGWLDELFGRQGPDALVQHERRHLDHMHVRFYNREAQEHGRLAYPALVEAGLLPGPMVKHRVARGETLSHLARRYGTSTAVIRTANGLRGSSLRAGRTYLIPVRKIPTPGEPTLIPPRRLPPDSGASGQAAWLLLLRTDFFGASRLRNEKKRRDREKRRA